jgi:hypothetical protein
MSAHLCPNCRKYSFTWSINLDESPLTKWGCFECYYIAWEDESKERICTNCNNKTESLLQDDQKKYWWCSSCDRITILD